MLRQSIVCLIVVASWATVTGCRPEGNAASQTNSGSGANVVCQQESSCSVNIAGGESSSPAPTQADESASAPASDARSARPTPSVDSNSHLPPASGVLLGTEVAGPDAEDTGIIVDRSENASYGMDVDAETFAINGVPIRYGWIASCKLFCGSAETSYVDLNLGRKYSRFSAVFGIADDSSGQGPINIEVTSTDSGQTKLLYSDTFNIGSGARKSINVTGILRLRVSFIGPLGSTEAALGDPTLYP